MAIRRIEYLGSEVLRKPGAEVSTFDDELRSLVEDMFATMYHAEGIGLAAPQIGLSLRLFVVDVPEEEVEEGGDAEGRRTPGFKGAIVNPVIAEVGADTEKAPEGCLSIPGLEGVVERPRTVVVEGRDPEGEPVRVEASGLVARALQHEIDHLDGILFLDRVGPLKRKMLLKKWKKLQEEAREEETASR